MTLQCAIVKRPWLNSITFYNNYMYSNHDSYQEFIIPACVNFFVLERAFTQILFRLTIQGKLLIFQSLLY